MTHRLAAAAAAAALFSSLMAAQAAFAQAVDYRFTVDPKADAKPISPWIYGVNQTITNSNASVTRLGGNRWTAYNWETNASNAGKDFQYQNDGFLGGGNTPGGAVAPTLNAARDNGGGVILTIPMAGYVSADKNGGGDVRNSGPNYLQTRFNQTFATSPGAFPATPSLTDGRVYQDEFVNWVKTNYPHASTDPKRPVMFSLDNEPDLWNDTHPEVHPNPVTYGELVTKTIDHAKGIKAVMPGAKVLGPVNYGFSGFVNLQNAPDANGRDFHTFYLQEMKKAEAANGGKRLVDALDVHWYPEARGGGVRVTGTDTSAAVVAARLQAPRSLWDPTYTETSWIAQDYYGNQPIKLLPRLRDKIAAEYAGTGIAITEYDYGGGQHISGGIAQADVLGIFGREGVYAANQWNLNTNEPFVGGAFRMFRNFDGKNGAFGDTSVRALTDNVADTSVYASTDSADPTKLVLVVINKTAAAKLAQISLAGLAPDRPAAVYTLTAASADPAFAGNVTIANPAAYLYTMPAYSVSTIVVTVPEPGAAGAAAAAGAAGLLLRRPRR